MAKTQLKYTDVVPAPLILAFQKQKDSLTSFIHWNPIWSETKKKYLKVPIQKINSPDTHLKLQQALSSDNAHSTLGLVFSNAHAFIALDVDGVNPDTTPSLKKFLDEHPTYAEASPSGKPHRTRLIYKLPTIASKAKLKPKTKIIPEDQQQRVKAEIELFNSSNNYTTLTGQELAESTHSITMLSVDDLLEHFPTFRAKSDIIPINDDVKEQLESSHTASLIPAKTWVNTVPIHRDNAKLNLVMDRHALTYYEFWLQGIMCIHSAWGSMLGYQYADEWSKQSEDDYDPEELHDKWESLDDEKDAKITRATYQWMFGLFSVDWPVLKGSSKMVPAPTEISNFTAFIKNQGISIGRDAISLTYFLSGQADSDVYPRYYKDSAQAYSITGSDLDRLSRLLQINAEDYHFRPEHKKMKEFMISTMSVQFRDEYTNRFAESISNHRDHDPETHPDIIKLIATSIIQRNPNAEHPTQDFHNTLIRKWLLSLGRTFWPNELSNPAHAKSTSEGVLILSDGSTSGAASGGINKSSFGVRLFPEEWRHLYSQSSPGRGSKQELKEYYFETTTKCLIDWDEVDGVINSNLNDATLKNIITANNDTARNLYAQDPIAHNRRYSLMASTNKSQLVLPDEGIRRFWWLNIRYVDTYKLDTWNMYDLWSQIRYELSHYKSDVPPWVLTAKEKKYLQSYLNDHRSSSSLRENLLDRFDWTEQGFIDKKKYTEQRAKAGKLKLSSNYPLVKHATLGLNEIVNMLDLPSTKSAYVKQTVVKLLNEFAPNEIFFKRTKVVNGQTSIQKQQRFFLPLERNDELMRESVIID